MEAAPNLRLVGDDAASSFPWPETGEMLSIADAHYRIRDLQDEREGLLELTAKQAGENAVLSRRIAGDEDPMRESAAPARRIVERWLVHHPRAVLTKGRVKMVRARLADGYALDSEKWLPDHPTLELAVDGVAAFPFLLFGKRKREGAASQRYDDLKDALGDGAKVEESARAGYRARKAGWTPEEGWPE